ncbi:hypothetical protein UT4_02780 [Ferrigenium sp. UT4]
MAGSAAAITCTSVATKQTDWNKSAAWTNCGGTQPPAGATVIIANGTNILADANTLNVANITVNTGGILAIKSGNTISFSGNLTNNGTFTAPAGSTVALTGTNQTITGNTTFANLTLAAGTQLTLAGNITITGTTNLTAGQIVSTCPTNYTITNQTTGVVQNSCATGGGGGGAACNSLLPPMPAGGNVVASGGTTAVGAGTNVNGVAVTGTGNSILNPGTTTAWSSAGAALAAPPSPIPTSTVITTVGAGGLAAGSYGDVRVTTGTRAFTGGNYFINELYVAPGATAQLAPGDYYVNKLTVGNSNTSPPGGTITLSGNGLVRIFVTTNAKNDTALYGGSSGIWDGSSVNNGGNPANLQILLYSGVTYFEIGNNTLLTGFVVQPVYAGAAGNKAIDVHQGTTITGGVFTAGLLNIKSNVTFNYTAAVASALTAMSSCAGPHHFEIQHADGQGVTCTPSTLTIKACADNAIPCAPYTAGISGTLSAAGTSTVNFGGGNAFTIPAGSSTVAKNIQVTTVGSVTLDATSTPAPVAATSCSWGTCTFTSANSALLVSAPNHLAESVSTLTIQAVKAAPGNPLVCAPGMTGTKTVNLKCAYTNPASGTQAVRVAGTALNAANNATAACGAGGANVSLTFDPSGIAKPSLQYADVGQMTLNATYTGSAGTGDAGLVMTGSGSFIAAPASFAFSAITAAPIKAGTNFNATVTAKNNAGNATPNFGKESAAEGVTLSSNLVSPGGGTNPAIANNTISGGTFVNGAATANNLSWGEVGIITLTANLTSGSYLGSALTATGTSGNVGSFIPDHFDTAVVATATVPMPCPTGLTCPTLYNGFIYSGQPFSVQVIARNLAGGTTTNYHGAFGLSNNVTLSVWDALGSTTTQNPGPGALANNTVVAAAFSAGVGTMATPTYTFSASPTAPTNIFVRAVDSVNTVVTSLRAIPSSSVEGGVKVVSGRVKIGNAHGSELLDLPMSATVQYHDGTNWLTSLTDSVTSLTLGLSNYQCKTGCAWTTTPTPASGQTIAGILSFKLSKPTGGGTGSVDVSITAPNYLLAGSNGAAVNPSKAARATFGVYKGNNEFIYLREVY